MNSSHDEYGPVAVDACMAVHNTKTQKRIDAISQHVNAYDDEPAISKLSDTVTDGNSQECVGDVIFTPNDKISVRKRTNATWAAIRGAHKIPKKKKQDEGNTRGLIHQRSYAEVAAASE